MSIPTIPACFSERLFFNLKYSPENFKSLVDYNGMIAIHWWRSSLNGVLVLIHKH
jgi:hypothetical protein